MKKILMLMLSVIIFSCTEEKTEEQLKLENKTFSWYTKNFQQIQKDSPTDISDIWYLYFDDELTCETCKLKILSQIKIEESVVILTSFSNDHLLNAFKDTYHLENSIINFSENRSELSVPFLFQMEETRMYNLTLLDDDMLERDLIEFMEDQ